MTKINIGFEYEEILSLDIGNTFKIILLNIANMDPIIKYRIEIDI